MIDEAQGTPEPETLVDNQVMETGAMKICTKCCESKQLTEFYKHAKKRDGLQPHCKDCARGEKADWRKANSESEKDRHAKYRSENREKVNASSARWQSENPEKRREKVSKWRAANPETRRVHDQNRRSRSVGRLSAGLAKHLLTLQRGKCACGCKQPLGDNYHLDHIMPLALGGTNTDDNIQLLRSKCNLKKSAKHPVEFMQSKGYLL